LVISRKALYYIDGQTLKMKDQYGEPIYYFEGIPKKWILVCILSE
jgi:hypothetical protein